MMNTTEQTILVTTTVQISYDDIANLMISAFEGGSNYWCMSVNPGKEALETFGNDWYTKPEFWASDFTLKIVYDPEDTSSTTIYHDDLIDGLNLMADVYPWHFNAIVVDEADANTADVLWQCMVLKEVVYG
jgi:hypothetical protein